MWESIPGIAGSRLQVLGLCKPEEISKANVALTFSGIQNRQDDRGCGFLEEVQDFNVGKGD